MFKIIYNRYGGLLMAGLAAFALFTACKKTSARGPEITGVRNYAPTPGDTTLSSLTPAGQWVVLEGRNLKNAVEIAFDGVPVSFNYELFSDTSAVVQLPVVIPFNTVSASDQNTIKYVTTAGSTTFKFNIVVPPPAITGISNEMAGPGDSVRITGANFFLISDLRFSGTPITAYNVSPDGTSIGFVVPALTNAGPVSITTKSGAAVTPFNVEDTVDGVLCNFDNVNTYQFWSAALDNSSTDFPGNRGQYAVLNTGGPLNAGDGSWWNGGRGINCNSAQWVPASNLSDPIGNWALKFEISVPTPWNGISIFIVKDFSWTYLARYEPWENSNGAASSYTTTGWQTVTIPLSSFLTTPNGKLDGTGNAAPNLTTLLGSSGSGGVNMYAMNDGASASPTGLYAGIDNIRVVKIQ
jgi:hypothetical protein